MSDIIKLTGFKPGVGEKILSAFKHAKQLTTDPDTDNRIQAQVILAQLAHVPQLKSHIVDIQRAVATLDPQPVLRSYAASFLDRIGQSKKKPPSHQDLGYLRAVLDDMPLPAKPKKKAGRLVPLRRRDR